MTPSEFETFLQEMEPDIRAADRDMREIEALDQKGVAAVGKLTSARPAPCQCQTRSRHQTHRLSNPPAPHRSARRSSQTRHRARRVPRKTHCSSHKAVRNACKSPNREPRLVSEFVWPYSPNRSAHYLSYLSRGMTRFAKLKTRWLNWNAIRLSDASLDTSDGTSLPPLHQPVNTLTCLIRWRLACTFSCTRKQTSLIPPPQPRRSSSYGCSLHLLFHECPKIIAPYTSGLSSINSEHCP
jgi:hypothetical protein